MVPSNGWGSTLKAKEQLRGESLVFTISPQEFLKLIWSTPEGLKAKSTLEPPSGFENNVADLMPATQVFPGIF